MKYLVISPEGEMELRDARTGSSVPDLKNIEGSAWEVSRAEIVLSLDVVDGYIDYVFLKNRQGVRLGELDVTHYA